MKSKIGLIVVTLIAMALFIGCANLPIPGVPGVPGAGDAKSAVKKAVTVGTVEVLDIAMEKTADNLKGTITVAGNAVYTPAKIGAKDFKDYGWAIKVSFFDAQGKKLPFHISWLEYGDYGKSENVKPNEPFPFTGEINTYTITGGMDTFNKAESCKVTKFECIG